MDENDWLSATEIHEADADIIRVEEMVFRSSGPAMLTPSNKAQEGKEKWI